jgi:exopolysaccharide biosynthesis polyprenyl glycosylphosphotransferase
MRRFDLTFTALHVPLDFFALLAAAFTAYALRTSSAFQGILPMLQGIPFREYLTIVLLFSGIWIILFAMAGLYSTTFRRAWNELGRLILACTAGTMVVIATIFFRREVTTSRFLVLAIWPIAIVYVWFFRLLLRFFRRALLRAHLGHQHIVVIGQDKTALDIANLYKTEPVLGYTVIKTFKNWNASSFDELKRLTERHKIDGVLLADPAISKEQALEIIAFAEAQHLTFRYIADLFAAHFTRIDVSTVGGIPVIEVKRTPLDGWGRIAKRLFDLVTSGILIIIFSPIMLLTMIAVKCTSRGPVFFHLDDDKLPLRVGETGQPFKYLKFRSMYPHTHMQRYKELAHLDFRNDGPLVKIKDDPRITPVGRFIRKWSIDELSELLLVFSGRMSLVGPRPHYPEEVAKYKPHHRRVLAIKPGITGMAQISGRSDLNFEEEVRLDMWYIENWSLWLDLYILLKTPFAVLSHRGVEEGV